MNSGKTVDWIKYADAYCDFINAHNCKYYFELDLDVIIGVEQTKNLHSILRQERRNSAFLFFTGAVVFRCIGICAKTGRMSPLVQVD